MTTFRVRADLDRAVVDGFALPLGIVPGAIRAPLQGYTVAYTAGHDDEPDTYSFYVAVSHERIGPIVRRAFALLPEDVAAIVEISSCDAYRQLDVFLSREEISLGEFERVWRRWENVLLEDGSIAVGANAEQPFVEVFLDQWKGLSLIVPLSMREEVESMLRAHGLDEVPHTWPVGDAAFEEAQIRPILEAADGLSADIDDVLLELRRDWILELNVDPSTNVDESGRRLGMTLWHAVVGVQEAPAANGDEPGYAELSIWATAGSLNQLEDLIDGALGDGSRWVAAEIFSTDRVAYDERPDELTDLPPRRREPGIHLLTIEPSGPQP